MTDWTAGYVADIDYTFGYYTELNPLRVKLAFLNAGLAYPAVSAACELGYGQGLSINLHAAASATHWCGTDFNPSQAAFAQELSAASGASCQLQDDAFEEFVNRTDLPDFDFIGMHGIWSWVSDKNRTVIVDFLRKKLKVGGVLFVSYNTMPGWAVFAPMRHLLTEHTRVLGAQGSGTASRIDGALDFAGKLLATDPIFSRAHPQIADRLEIIKKQNRHYIAHEYFNREWRQMQFSHMAEWLEPAKLQYACSAHYQDHIDSLNLSERQQALLHEIPDAVFRENVRDFMVSQQFRRDYWVKGARRLTPLEKSEGLRAQKIMLIARREQVSLAIKGALGEASLSEAIYTPILEFLGEHKAKTLGQLESAVKAYGISFVQVVQAAMVLAGAGHLHAVQDDAVIAKAKKYTEKLNAHLVQKARGSAEISYLASPVTGGGYPVGRFPQIFLSLLAMGHKQPAEWVQPTWQILSAQGQRILKDGRSLESAEENLAELTHDAHEFADKQLPLLKALQIA